MIQTEMIGDKLIRHYSDSQYRIRQVETNVVYDDAVDVYPCPYTYEETNEPITQETVEVMRDLKKEMQSMVAPVENTDSATRNYDSNDMLMLNDNVYKVIEPIGVRSRIVEYYNVVPTTVGAQLSEIINNTEE